MRTLVLIAALFAAACSPQTQTSEPPLPTPEALPVPPHIANAIEAVMPGVVITSGATDGQGEYEATGTLNGQEYEFDIMGPDGGWRVVEIQRDIVWADAPTPVRDVVATAPNALLPVRVIESRQPADGSVIYELFAEGAPEAPAMEVRFLDGQAAIMPPAH